MTNWDKQTNRDLQTDKQTRTRTNQLPREDGEMWSGIMTDRQTFRIMEIVVLASCRARVGVV